MNWINILFYIGTADVSTACYKYPFTHDLQVVPPSCDLTIKGCDTLAQDVKRVYRSILDLVPDFVPHQPSPQTTTTTTTTTNKPFTINRLIRCDAERIISIHINILIQPHTWPRIHRLGCLKPVIGNSQKIIHSQLHIAHVHVCKFISKIMSRIISYGQNLPRFL